LKTGIKISLCSLIPNKDIDSREIIARVKNEGYDIDTVSISKLFTKELKSYQEKYEDAYKRDLLIKKRLGKGTEIKRKVNAPPAEPAEVKMHQIREREKTRKREFINTLADIEFSLGETFMDDNTRVFVHQAAYKRKRLVIISYALEGRIDRVSLLFESTGGKQSEEFFFDLSELQGYNEKVIPSFIKSKLGFFSKMLGVPGTLETIWFLTSILSVKRKLPIKTVEFIQNTFLIHLKEIEADLHNMIIQQAMQK